MVDGGQTDVFIAAPVAGGEVGVEQFVVIGDLATAEVGGDGVAGHVVVVGLDDQNAGRRGISIGVEHRAGRGVMGDVVEEGVGCADRAEIVGAPILIGVVAMAIRLIGLAAVPEMTMSSAVLGVPSAPRPTMT